VQWRGCLSGALERTLLKRPPTDQCPLSVPPEEVAKKIQVKYQKNTKIILRIYHAFVRRVRAFEFVNLTIDQITRKNNFTSAEKAPLSPWRHEAIVSLSSVALHHCLSGSFLVFI